MIDLVKKGASITTMEEGGKISCLTLACMNINKDFEIVKYLILEMGMDPNEKISRYCDNYSFNLIYILKTYEHISHDPHSLFHLLMLGADPNLKNKRVKFIYLFILILF